MEYSVKCFNFRGRSRPRRPHTSCESVVPSFAVRAKLVATIPSLLMNSCPERSCFLLLTSAKPRSFAKNRGNYEGFFLL